ncbi:dihydrofolate reductase family protein [Corynebacterium kutscheri]|uniref:dihydrofolate reductase family protein n=1 Tax=Corynebacterium kutscheri TaxID=35755 RepID=UPI0037BF30F2
MNISVHDIWDDPIPGREIRAIMAMSINGATAVKHTSGQLGNELDRDLLLYARSWSDCVLVGAGTVRTENYGGIVQLDTEHRPIIVVSASGKLDTNSRLFTDTHTPPIIISNYSIEKNRRQALEKTGARVLHCDTSQAHEITQIIYSLGYQKILLEGGPRLYTQFISSGLIDAFNLTLSPKLVSGSIQNSVDTHGIQDMDLKAHYLHTDGTVFLRYRRV